MVEKAGPEDLDVKIRFGAGLHTRASEDEIDAREAADGQNFVLDLQDGDLKNRPPFDLIATVPNASSINGGATLLKADGTVSTLVQAGTTVYEWDGVTTFTSKGTVSTNAKLRGHWRNHNFTLDDKVIITDIALAEVVKEWDGTTFQSVTFTDEQEPPQSFGNFFAKYLSVSNERAIFSNVKTITATPHLVVGSKRGDFTEITTTQRPASAVSEEDPFFIPVPDLRPINGHVEAFGSTILSTEQGQIFNLTGTSASNFAIADFYPGSAASGDESLVYIGNDIIYGRKGRIESVTDTDRFGDSEADDLTVPISDQIEGFGDWQGVYNSRLNRVYMFPGGQSEVWVFETAMLRGERSPWMKWVTSHALAFQPTFVMSMLDPSDGLEYVFMGDSSGNWYRLEGTGSAGDGGSANIRTEWLTRLFTAPLDTEASDIEGYIKYRKGDAATVILQFEYSGEAVYNETIRIDIPQITGASYYTNQTYYTDGAYYGVAFSDRLTRQLIVPPGGSNEFQVRVVVEGAANFKINEIGLRFRAATQ